MMWWIIGTIIWLVIGWLGFVYWWTKDFDLDLDELPFAVLISILGPVTWLIGIPVHGQKVFPKKQLLRKKDKRWK